MGDYASCYLTEPLWNYFAWLFLVFAVNGWIGLFSIRHIYCCLNKPCYSLQPIIFILLWCFMWVVLATAGFLVWFDYCGWYGYTWQLCLYTLLVVISPLWFWFMFWCNGRYFATTLALLVFVLSVAVTVVFFMIDISAGVAMLVFTIWLLYITWWSWRVFCMNRGICFHVQTKCMYEKALPTRCIQPAQQCHPAPSCDGPVPQYYAPVPQKRHHGGHRFTSPDPCVVGQTMNTSVSSRSASLQAHSAIDVSSIHV
jgi:tryptophan-rich sensory protein